MHQNNKLSLLFTYVMALLFFLSVFSFPFFRQATFDYLSLLLCIVLFPLCYYKSRIKIVWSPIFFVLLLIILTLVSVVAISRYEAYIMIIYIARHIIWAVVLGVLVPNMLVRNIFHHAVIVIAIVATFYLIFQNILHYFLGYDFADFRRLVPFLSSSDPSMLFESANTSARYRASSIFLEPAQYSYFTICALSIVLFNSKQKRPLAILFLFGIIISFSTAGIYLLIILLITYYYTVNKRNSIRLIFCIFVLAALIAAIYLFVYPSLKSMNGFGATVRYALDKPFKYYETSSRLGGSYSLLENLDGLISIIGVGIGNEYVYFGSEPFFINSVTRLMIQSGYIGLAAFVALYLHLLSRVRTAHALFQMVLYAATCLTGGGMFGTGGIFILALAVIEPSGTFQTEKKDNYPESIIIDKKVFE